MSELITECRMTAGLDVMVQLEQLPQRLKSSVIGLEKGKYIIVKCPNMASFNQRLRAGLKIKVTYLNDGNVYGFKANILSHIQAPGRLIFVQYPDSVERIELRREHRLDSYLPATVTAEDKACKGFITNISPNGCQFSAKTGDLKGFVLNEGSELQIDFQFIGLEGDQSLRGTVRNLQQNTEITGLGLQFQDTDQAVREKIQSYVREVLKFSDI